MATSTERSRKRRAALKVGLAKTTAERIAALETHCRNLETRLQALEDRPPPAAPTAVRPTLAAVPMNPAMQALMAQQPPKGVTRDGEVIPTQRTFQGRPVRTCCQSVEGQVHTDLCQAIV